MTQSKLESLIESIINAIIGMGIGLASQLGIFYILDITVTFSQNAWMVVWFTAISIARSYVIRRWFNERLRRTLKGILA